MGNCFVGEMRNEEKSDSGALFDGNVEKLNVAILKARIKEIAGKLPSEYQRSFKKENYSEMLTCIESYINDLKNQLRSSAGSSIPSLRCSRLASPAHSLYASRRASITSKSSKGSSVNLEIPAYTLKDHLSPASRRRQEFNGLKF